VDRRECHGSRLSHPVLTRLERTANPEVVTSDGNPRSKVNDRMRWSTRGQGLWVGTGLATGWQIFVKVRRSLHLGVDQVN